MKLKINAFAYYMCLLSILTNDIEVLFLNLVPIGPTQNYAIFFLPKSTFSFEGANKLIIWILVNNE